MENCISVQELFSKLKAKSDLIIVDVRSSDEYDEKHIPNALNIPLDNLAIGAEKFDKEKLIVTVCGKGGGRSETGAKQLQELGYNAIYLCDGTLGWFSNNGT